MKKHPLVTIVIPCYNYAGYVAKAIESVLEQTYQNIELIVINDGSTDDSDQIISKLKEKNNFIYINQKNVGVIKTRNIGVASASGEYIVQLDADDWLDKTYIKKCVHVAETKMKDIVYTQAQVFGRISFKTNHIKFDLEKLKHDNYIHASALVRCSALRRDPYDKYLDDKGNEDWDLFLGLCLAGAKAELIDQPLLHYKKHYADHSRSDRFAGAYNEALVRHHIWSKYNNKYPEHFGYMSSEINGLYEMIKLHEKFINLNNEYENLVMSEADKNVLISNLNQKIQTLESRDLLTILKRMVKKITKT